MAGGYLDSDMMDEDIDQLPVYRFNHWHLIDIFIYFSHHFITIPPLRWINQAHSRGVKVYGTVIFEDFKSFSSEPFIELLNPEKPLNWRFMGHHLDRIRRELNFEGWLINFEAQVAPEPNRKLRHTLSSFLNLLRSLGSEVIWYDALTWSGKLKFQNALSFENKCYFAASDGIFTNYVWNYDLLRQSQAL
ncbi:hypothetical protein Ciccas_009215 [Cichlidogyrus casuarinus]|uniref:Cytosolic endo-beta-N-acetylglucosaminidase TIM barrel domain-containing protein n=1 Tax=Cichlidogyrus casuarinus TaxID=1844966 RepID=A0ABD2PXQ1_9PLAT